MKRANHLVLVVEDDPVCARAIARALRTWIATLLASSCGQARDMFTDRVSGVIVDVGLKDGSGLDLLAEFLARRPNLISLVLTGRDDPALTHRAFELGAAFLRKPVGGLELRMFVERVLSSPWSVTLRIRRVVGHWTERFQLTSREAEIILAAIDGADHARLASLAEVKPATIKKQSHAILQKTGRGSLQELVSAVLREALEQGPSTGA